MTRPENTPALEAEQSESGAVRRSGVDPEKTYHGGACKHCGGTLRWKSGRACVPCGRKRQAASLAADPEMRERRRAYGRAYQRARMKNDPEWLERKYAYNRTYNRDRYDNDTLFRHRHLLERQLQRSQRRLKEAERG